MGWFNKKKSNPVVEETPKPLPCNHKWKDFSWYIDSTYFNDTRKLAYDIYEPYVCVFCHERKNVKLFHCENFQKTFSDAADAIHDVKKMYSQIKERPIVEDEINDFLLVDREYLEILEKMKSQKANVVLDI